MPTPITQLPGVGGKVAEKLKKIQVHSIEDLLFHLPLRYQDRTRIYPIARLPIAREALFEAQIQSVKVLYQGRRVLSVRVCDDSACLSLKFFHFSKVQQAMFRPGRRLRCFGELRLTRAGKEMVHPECQWVDMKDSVSEQAYVPIYPLTEGISQYNLRRMMKISLKKLQQDEVDLEELLGADSLDILSQPMALKEAITYIHSPPADADTEQLLECAHPAQQRLAFEEILAHTVALRHLRQKIKKDQALALPPPGPLFEQLKQSLPFDLTAAQQRVIKEIHADLSLSAPMIRLVQGDVGSGKTVVAVAAMLAAIQAGGQCGFMAPTETLAEQHYQTLTSWLSRLNIHVCLIVGRQKSAQARSVQRQARTGEANIVIGTHALFQEKTEFANLVLLVIDEQHRFGVHQRLALKKKGEKRGYSPHQLIMTATPIPRSLAMTMYADLDHSVLDELPPGRSPVQTITISQSRRHEVIERVGHACQVGKQAYWVCPLIEESDKLQAQAAEQVFQTLCKAMPNIGVALIHGRMKREEKESILFRFRAKEIQLLVATTIIEVGVDVPNATLMVIENAERFGLAQLHQLRGRVGRGKERASCVLLYDAPLSDIAKQRLDVLRRTTDGFEIAQQDMRIRGPGEFLGTRQTGVMRYRIADPAHALVPPQEICGIADDMLQHHAQQAQQLIQRWLCGVTEYADV